MAWNDPARALSQSISSARVQEAFRAVDRAGFVPASLQPEAWADRPLPIEDEATISQPSLVAQMTDWLNPQPDSSVLEIGTGSGYQTAILAELAAQVYTVEFSTALSETAQRRLDTLGYSNVHFRKGDGAEGWAAHAPYDRILATVAFPGKPEPLLDQLSECGGTALIPVGPPEETQHLIRYRRDGNDLAEENLLPVRFLSLR